MPNGESEGLASASPLLLFWRNVMLRKVIIALAVSSVFTAQAFAEKCASQPYAITTPEGYDHLRYAPGERERLYDGGAFVASVDGADDDNGDGTPEYLGQPQWVSSHIKAYRSDRNSGYAPGFKRPSSWYRIDLFDEERGVYGSDKRLDDSYRGVGSVWNRGHLAQRADANRLNEAYGCNTHVFANAVPQAAKFNQGIWLGLENTVSSLANQYGEVWVTTGPIFFKDKPIQAIGEFEKGEIPVAIPDALFKVVMIEAEGGVQVLSLIYPNVNENMPAEYLSGRCQSDLRYDHRRFIVSLAEVERQSGLTFFAQQGSELQAFKELSAPRLPSIDPQYEVGYCL